MKKDVFYNNSFSHRSKMLWQKFLKLNRRLEQQIATGQFSKLNKKRQDTLLRKLRHCFQKAEQLGFVLRGAVVGSALSLALVNTAQAQGFAAASTNPFGFTDTGGFSAPSFADLDGDGDLDAFVSTNDGDVFYFQNTGSAVSPAFATANTNPFGLTNLGGGGNTSPSLADLDGDGDLDASIGESNGNVIYFENTGSAISPAFASASTNPFNLQDVGRDAKPSFADLDGDGDLDAFVGNNDGNVIYFENTFENRVIPVLGTSSANPFGLSVGSYYSDSAPSFVDLDGDGDLDVIVKAKNSYDSEILYFENTGSAINPTFASASNNPFGLSSSFTTRGNTISFADLDGDGDLDAFDGTATGTIDYSENIGSATSPNFQGASNNPFGLATAGYAAKPNFADLDGDGDLDAFVGNSYGNVIYFENTGSAISPAFATSSTNPFGLANVGYSAAPSLRIWMAMG
ncbi:MAG: hypothetical protein HC892_22025, partial [Saprospiraceae bacterium]|nr:hypothetical protein [Saprospiraceae bacterium]